MFGEKLQPPLSLPSTLGYKLPKAHNDCNPQHVNNILEKRSTHFTEIRKETVLKIQLIM